MKYSIQSPDTDQVLSEVEMLDSSEGKTFSVTLTASKLEKFSNVLANVSNDVLEVSVGAERDVFLFQRNGAHFNVSTALGSFKWTCQRSVATGPTGAGRSGAKTIKSSMPGKVIKIFCKVGDVIEAGQPLMIIEAMKMENEIRSTQAGVIEEMPVQEGKKVETGEVLVKLGASQ